MYRLMNYSEAQIEQVQKFGLFKGNQMSWLPALFSVLPFLGSSSLHQKISGSQIVTPKRPPL